MDYTIGVMGSASGPIDAAAEAAVRRLGRAIADRHCTLITGACPGLPYAAVRGARGRDGRIIGISPAVSLYEPTHTYDSPVDGFDVLIYTGSGLMGREVINIRSSDIVVIVGGRTGTLGEFAIAYDEGRLIGVLTGTGGVADLVAELTERLAKDTGAVALYDDDPERLLDRLLGYYRDVHSEHPNCFCPATERPADPRTRRSANTAAGGCSPLSLAVAEYPGGGERQGEEPAEREEE